MPKRMMIFFVIIIALLSLLAVFSCGSGDKIGAGGTNPVDLVSGNNTGGTGGGGGGGAVSNPGCLIDFGGGVTYCYDAATFGGTAASCTASGGTWVNCP